MSDALMLEVFRKYGLYGPEAYAAAELDADIRDAWRDLARARVRVDDARSSQRWASGWACVDCLMLLANGETPPDLTAEQRRAYLAAVDARCDAHEVTLGMMASEHDASCPTSWGERVDGEDGCETQDFSWSPCDVCGSALGGSRDAVTFWWPRDPRGKSSSC